MEQQLSPPSPAENIDDLRSRLDALERTVSQDSRIDRLEHDINNLGTTVLPHGHPTIEAQLAALQRRLDELDEYIQDTLQDVDQPPAVEQIDVAAALSGSDQRQAGDAAARASELPLPDPEPEPRPEFQAKRIHGRYRKVRVR